MISRMFELKNMFQSPSFTPDLLEQKVRLTYDRGMELTTVLSLILLDLHTSVNLTVSATEENVVTAQPEGCLGKQSADFQLTAARQKSDRESSVEPETSVNT